MWNSSLYFEVRFIATPCQVFWHGVFIYNDLLPGLPGQKAAGVSWE